MSNYENEIKILSEEILAAHNKHYENSPTGLIDRNIAPNGNPIYHLYFDGEITQQKGGSAYLQRSEFPFDNTIYGYQKLAGLTMPKKYENGNSYAILTYKECQEFRNKMIELVTKISSLN